MSHASRFFFVHDTHALHQAQRRDLGMHDRIYWFAVARQNRIGHAEFGAGELAILLADTKTGKVPSAPQIANAIKRGRQLGILAQGSGSRCIITPAGIERRAWSNNSCGAHGINARSRAARPSP